MTGEGKRPFAALVAAVLAAALLTACGGGSDSDSSSSSTKATTAGSKTSAKAGGGAENGGQKDKYRAQSGDREKAGPKGKQDQQGGSNPKDVATPLEVSGGGSTQFRVKGGDNSIQEYGDESAESELQEVAEIVHGFLVARAERKWEKACSYLAKSNIEQLEQLAAQAPQSAGADCATILEAFTRPLPTEVEREITTVDARSFRNDGEQGFLIYYGAGQTAYAMPLRNEDGTWKVAALSATTLG